MLSQELEKCRTQLNAVTDELEKSKKAPAGNVDYCPENTILCSACFNRSIVVFTATGSSDQLEEKLRAAQADKQHAERQEAAGQRILTRTRDEKNKLQDANIKQAEELKDIRAQLSDTLKEN